MYIAKPILHVFEHSFRTMNLEYSLDTDAKPDFNH